VIPSRVSLPRTANSPALHGTCDQYMLATCYCANRLPIFGAIMHKVVNYHYTDRSTGHVRSCICSTYSEIQCAKICACYDLKCTSGTLHTFRGTKSHKVGVNYSRWYYIYLMHCDYLKTQQGYMIHITTCILSRVLNSTNPLHATYTDL